MATGGKKKVACNLLYAMTKFVISPVIVNPRTYFTSFIFYRSTIHFEKAKKYWPYTHMLALWLLFFPGVFPVMKLNRVLWFQNYLTCRVNLLVHLSIKTSPWAYGEEHWGTQDGHSSTRHRTHGLQKETVM